MQSIGEALRGRTILITGSTGFLAKALLEKILRDVPTLRRIYLLIRSRGGSNGTRLFAEDRLWRDVLSSSAFDRLRKTHGDDWKHFVQERVHPVSGDLSLDQLGLDDSAYDALCRDIDIVVNSAATVSFDERLDAAIQTNMLGPRRLLALCKRCRETTGRQVLYLHVSTAYANGWRTGDLLEVPFVPGETARALRGEADAPSLELDRELRFCQEEVERLETESRQERRLASFRRKAIRALPQGAREDSIDERAEILRQQTLKTRLVKLGMERAQHFGWNDTYTFTKAMGEMLVVREREGLPTIIMRPSIIESSMEEPQPGWLDGFRMADPLIIAYGKGVLPDFPARPEVNIDVVPVDFVVNAMVVALAQPPGNPQPLKVLHVATGAVSPLSFDDFYGMVRGYFERNPMTDRAGQPIKIRPATFPDPVKFIRMLRWRYLLPLRIGEWLANRSSLIPRKLRARIAYRRSGVEQAIYYSSLYSPYINYSYDFGVSRTLELFEKLSPEDKERFPFDVRSIDWRHYIQDIHIPGLKQNVLKIGSTNGRRMRRAPTPADLELTEWAGTEQETLCDVLRFVANRHGDRPALEMECRGGEREAFTYQGLLDASHGAAKRYAACGVSRGDRIVLWSESRPLWGVAYLGATGSGITVIPIDPQTTCDELARIILFTGASLVVASASTFRRAREQIRDFQVPILSLDDDLQPFQESPVAPGEPTRSTWGEAKKQDTASIIFTAGTTVDPKGVLLTHRNILSDAMAVGKVLRPYPTDRFLSVLPMHHVFEFTGGFLMPLWGGAKITYVETLKSRVILETMRSTQTTCMLAVPRLFEILHGGIRKQLASLSLPARLLYKANLGIARGWRWAFGRSPGRFLFRRLHRHFGGSLRLFVSGGAALEPEVCDTFSLLGLPICEGYGLTETSPVLTVNPLGRTRPGSVGKPLPGVELRIDAPDEMGVGEIVVRGDMLMRGYLRNPEATCRILRHGWLHTGDLGYLDKEGYLFITGRSKDLIVTGSGKNVYPNEVEALYRKALPHVREICVVGIRSKGGGGEEVHAVVVPDWSGWSKEREMEAWQREVAEAVKAISRGLPTYQRIQKVHYWTEELPKTSTLKVRRREVQEAILAGKEAKPSPTVEAAPVAGAGNGALSTDEFRRLLDVLGSITKVSSQETVPTSHLQFDLGMDSLMKVEMLAALEETFQIRIPDSLAAELTTVGDVAGRIAAQRVALRTDTRTAYWDRVLSGPTSGGEDALQKNRPIAGGVRRIFRWIGGVIYRRYLGIQVKGLENVPDDGACILVANHSSHLDSGAVLVALGGRGATLRLVAAKDYFFSTKIRSWFFRTVFNAIPFDRREQFLEGLRVCRAALDRGERLLIFPEGTRSVTGELQPFKAGVGLLAVELGVPVIPTRIQGTYEAMPKGSFWPRPGRIEVTFGEPLKVAEPPTDTRYEVYREVADRVRRRVEALA